MRIGYTIQKPWSERRMDVGSKHVQTCSAGEKQVGPNHPIMERREKHVGPDNTNCAGEMHVGPGGKCIPTGDGVRLNKTRNAPRQQPPQHGQRWCGRAVAR